MGSNRGKEAPIALLGILTGNWPSTVTWLALDRSCRPASRLPSLLKVPKAR